jgi:hypothetical protein
MEREKPKMMRVLVQKEDGTKEYKTVPADSIRSGIRKHETLPPDLVERAKKLFPRAGNAVYPTMQKWLDCFLCDQYPDQEIAIWEQIADVTDKLWLEEPKPLAHLDRKTLTHVVIAVSTNTVDIPSQIDGVTDEQVEIIRTAWAAE